MRSGGFSLLLALALVMGSFKGYLALFTPGDTEPQQIFPVKTASLPEPDRMALEEGIIIRSRSHMQQLVERYLGQGLSSVFFPEGQ